MVLADEGGARAFGKNGDWLGRTPCLYPRKKWGLARQDAVPVPIFAERSNSRRAGICLGANCALSLSSARGCQLWWQPSGASSGVVPGSQRLSSSKGQSQRKLATQSDGPCPVRRHGGCTAEGVATAKTPSIPRLTANRSRTKSSRSRGWQSQLHGGLPCSFSLGNALSAPDSNPLACPTQHPTWPELR